MTVTVITPPTTPDWSKVGYSVFLAGSIENGAAPDWQSEMIEMLRGLVPAHGDLTVFNPRRADWNPKASLAELEQQILWELEALERVDHIVMFYAANTVSPITLLEMGLHAGSRKLTVCCPSGFFRRTNVDIVCKRYGVVQVDTLAELARTVILARDSKTPPTPIAKARKSLLQRLADGPIGWVLEDDPEVVAALAAKHVVPCHVSFAESKVTVNLTDLGLMHMRGDKVFKVGDLALCLDKRDDGVAYRRCVVVGHPVKPDLGLVHVYGLSDTPHIVSEHRLTVAPAGLSKGDRYG